MAATHGSNATLLCLTTGAGAVAAAATTYAATAAGAGVLVRVLVWPSLEPRGVFVLGHLCVGVDERTRALIVSYHEYVWAFCFALRRRTENIEKAATNSSSKLFADGVPSSRRAIVTARNRLSCPARLLYLDTSPRFFARRLLVAWAVAPERF